MNTKASPVQAGRDSILIALAFCVSSAASVAGWLPALSDNALETIRAEALQRARPAGVGQLRNRSIQVAHPLGVQILFIEAKEQKKKASTSVAQAEVFLFDYHQVQASVELVNANTGELINKKALDTAQLPLNAVEADYATQLLRENTNFFDTLTSEYTQHFNQDSISSNDIDMKVSVWVLDSRVHTDTPCLISRCALVSVFTHNHFNFSVEPVVDLVTGDVYLELMQ